MVRSWSAAHHRHRFIPLVGGLQIFHQIGNQIADPQKQIGRRAAGRLFLTGRFEQILRGVGKLADRGKPQHSSLAFHRVELARHIVGGEVVVRFFQLNHRELNLLKPIRGDFREFLQQRLFDRLGVHPKDAGAGLQSALNRLISSARRVASWVSSAVAPVACLDA